MKSQNDRKIAFFGRMTANLTHEMKNILAIIQESAGLMEDITAISPLSETRFQDKFNNALQSIKGQLQRGMELTTRFNRFAHTPDHSRADLDLADAVAQLRALAERFARLKYITLDIAGAGAAPVRVETNPVGVYMAIFFGVESCISILPAQSRVVLTPARRNGNPAVGVHCTGEGVTETPTEFSEKIVQASAWSELTLSMDQLGAVDPDGETPGFWLVFG